MSSEETRMATKVGEHDFDPLIPEELEGCHEMYSSVSKFIEYLTGTADSLSSDKTREGLVFWTPQNASRSRTVQEKITIALRKLEWPYLFVQFWAPKEVGGRRYLTTLDQPFAVAYLFKGLCFYRKESMKHKYMVEEEEHLGPPGRVFRNGINLESSPDLLLYSMEEFPLRNLAASCGLRSYLALPVFDLVKDQCIGVLEFLNFQSAISFPASEIQRIDSALKVADMRSTQNGTSTVENLIYDQQPQLWEVREMLELAIKTVPQLHLVQVWVPCEQSPHTNNDYGMKRADFINNVCAETNSLVGVSKTTCEFVYTCEFQKIHSEQKIVGLAMSSPNKSCFCRSFSEFNISEYSMAHYAQRARLSFCFAICLKSDGIESKNDQYVFEFFLQPQSRDDAYICLLLGSLIHIMVTKLKSFKIANGKHLRDVIVVDEIRKRNRFPSLESGQESVSGEYIQYGPKTEHQLSLKNTLVEPMDESNDIFTLPEVREYLQKSDWSCLQAPLRGGYGWIFRSIKGEIIESKYGANNDLVLQNKIKLLLRKILSVRTGEANPNLLIQFWRKKVIESRPYLSTSDQLFALGCLSTELCSFRMECMKHDYYIGDGAKEEKLGPIRRVFLNRHPESSPDMRLYSNREFPLIQDLFVPSDARRYLALPLFDLHDQICVGVLEFVGCPFDFEDIVEKLEATNLRSIHINHHAGFKESCFPEKNAVDGQQVAFNEISEMVELVVKSPQLHVASVWIPCSECDHSDLKISCFELVRFSDIDLLEPSDKRIHDFMKACKFLRLEPRKGVIGRILESENMLCFCQNFCDFNIIDQPLVHYAQVARLDVYFAICLQSSHTGNIIYILEFFLSHGRPWSFLRSLLSIMKQKLKSFKVASGQQLGRELISEAIEFRKGEEFAYLQSGYVDSLLLKFETAQYGHKMEHQEHFTFDSLGSAGKNEDEEQSLSGITSVDTKTSKHERYRIDISDVDLELHIGKRHDVEEESEVAKIRNEGGRSSTSFHVSYEQLKSQFGRTLKDAAKNLGVSKSTFKRTCREFGIKRWSSKMNNIKNPSLFQTKVASKCVENADQQASKPSGSDLTTSDFPVEPNISSPPIQNTMEHANTCQAADVVMKVKFKDDTLEL